MKKLMLVFLPLLVIACKCHVKTGDSSVAIDLSVQDSAMLQPGKLTTGLDIDLETLKDSIDISMNIDTLSLSDIRILRNSFAAQQGYCFMKADLRAIFSTTSWYEKRMEDRFWAEDEGKSIKPISYSKEEQAFIDKLQQRENELLLQNYIHRGDRKMANLRNIVNLFQLEEINPALMDMLGRNGFAIVPNDNIQFFHVYEQNDYKQFPHFVTTDMYLQLFHMYFGYILKTIEEEKFIPLLSNICRQMKAEMERLAAVDDKAISEAARYNATFYAIAYTLLTNEKTAVPPEYENLYKEELAKAIAARDEVSDFLEYNPVQFPYSLFKPRGHYTRNEELKRYFRAMMWLQTAPFCLDNDKQLKRAILSAAVLVNGTHAGNDILANYKAILEPVSFIIGLPDNVSFLQLAELIKKENMKMEDLLTRQKSLESFRKEVKKMADKQNRIRPKEALSCVDKINFMPQRYLADNEIIQELVDVESKETKRAYPKGLDVMAAFGSASAEDILLNELKEDKTWSEYPKILNHLKSVMADINWDASLYNKWMQSLVSLQKPDKTYPYFMQTPQWAKKDLNTSLASWAELKHDAILYAEQPMAAECGDGGPPAPYTVAYVEPNLNYWGKVVELIGLTEETLKRNNLMNEDIKRITERLKENAEFLLNASRKELNGERLSDKEYQSLEYIGSTFEWITLDLVKSKDQYLDGWENVQGPDKSVAVVADIYTSNASNNSDRGILHVATGYVNDIYVVVEIEGYLYITKGAVFGYHEFHLPMGNRLTDEEWQQMLDKKQAPGMPEWLKEIIVPIIPPKANEKIFYSSGC